MASLSIPVAADTTTEIPRIGVLPLTDPGLEEALRKGLRDLGYIEGRTIVIEWRRSTEMTEKHLRALAMELVRSRIDIIVALGSLPARAALEATTVPVVYMSSDPVSAGLAQSLARPGGHGTGVSVVTTNLDSKRLELLKEVSPRARRIVLLRNPDNPLSGKSKLDEAARAMSMELVKLEPRNAQELDDALRTINRIAADGILIAGDALFFANRAKVAQAIRKARLPGIFPWPEYHAEGVLMSYGVNLTEATRRTAFYVDKILKGTKPQEIPIEQIFEYKLTIDLHVARDLRLDVPEALLVRADEVIR
jgi:putative ABC transport system substrate-binding protein